MPQLILMRHAKSSWKTPGQRDHARPLNKRGQADAPAMGRRLVDAGWVPDLALVSDAARTEETWAWMRSAFEHEVPFQLLSGLYHAGPDAMITALRAHVTDQQSVLILAHNPGLEEAVELWSGEHRVMKTSNAVLLEHPGDWHQALKSTDWRLGTQLHAPSRDP